MIAAELDAETFNGEIVVVALRKPGDGDTADDSGASDVDGEAAAMGGVVGVRESVFFAEGCAGVLEVEADLIGTAVEAGYHVGFALHPAGVVGRGAGKGGIEERLIWMAKAANVDDDRELTGKG